MPKKLTERYVYMDEGSFFQPGWQKGISFYRGSEFRGSRFKVRKQHVALDQQYITKTEFQDVYDHAGLTRAAISGFIKYLPAYEQGCEIKATLNP